MSDERLVEPRSAAERDDQRRAAERIASAMFDRLRELRFAPRNVDELAGVVDDALERAGVTPGVLEALRESVRDLDRAHRIRRERAIARALLMDEQVTPEEVEPWIDRVIARVDAELADPRASSEPSTELGSLTFSDRQEVEAIARSIVVASGARLSPEITRYTTTDMDNEIEHAFRVARRFVEKRGALVALVPCARCGSHTHQTEEHTAQTGQP